MEKEIRIEARPETVFQFFTDPAKMTLWMGRSVTLDPRPGGAYRVVVNDDHVARGEYLEVEPNSRVVFSWGWEGEEIPLLPGASIVEISLESDDAGTIVRLRHLGLPDELRGPHSEGWDHYLARLATAGAGGDPGPDEYEDDHPES